MTVSCTSLKSISIMTATLVLVLRALRPQQLFFVILVGHVLAGDDLFYSENINLARFPSPFEF